MMNGFRMQMAAGSHMHVGLKAALDETQAEIASIIADEGKLKGVGGIWREFFRTINVLYKKIDAPR
jgi:hypothetical protein